MPIEGLSAHYDFLSHDILVYGSHSTYNSYMYIKASFIMRFINLSAHSDLSLEKHVLFFQIMPFHIIRMF